jgi:hypothetical protein
MEASVDQTLPWLKYVDAGDLDDQTIDFDGMNVESPTGEHLGDVEGFIVDDGSGRPYYVVVDAGGWFKTKHFLLPVGQIRLDIADDDETLVADLTRDRVENFPGFDKDEFDTLSSADVKRINDETCMVITGSAVAYDPAEPVTAAWNRPAFAYPSWWSASPTRPDRMGEGAVTSGVRREQTTVQPPHTAADRDRIRPVSDESPHYAGRAQPGDVIGIETGGEQTHVGETSEDEDRRRDDAIKAVENDRDHGKARE